MYRQADNRVLVERRGPGRPFSASPAERASGVGRSAPRPIYPPVAEFLAFRVGIVASEPDLLRVQELRQQAYGHHLPGLAAHFGKPDPVDRWPGVTIFYAEDKESGRLVGAARLQCNRSVPLQVEHNLDLPDHLRGRHLAEVTRLAVLAGYAHPVRLALVKALHLHCVAAQIEGIIAASRPSLTRQYLNLGFVDMFEDGRMAPIDYAGGLPHRVLYRDAVTSEAFHRERNHPDYAFVFRTFHPEIQVFAAALSGPGSVRPCQVVPAEVLDRAA